MPATDKIANNGINIAAMESKLLEKIKEPTLYVIDLKKDRIELRKENQQQKEEINNLNEQLKNK